MDKWDFKITVPGKLIKSMKKRTNMYIYLKANPAPTSHIWCMLLKVISFSDHYLALTLIKHKARCYVMHWHWSGVLHSTFACAVFIMVWHQPSDGAIVCCVQTMGLLPDTQNYGLRMRREYRERFPRGHLVNRSSGGISYVTKAPWSLECDGTMYTTKQFMGDINLKQKLM